MRDSSSPYIFIYDVEKRHRGDIERFSSYNGVNRESLPKSVQRNPSSIYIRHRTSLMSQLMVAFKGCGIDYTRVVGVVVCSRASHQLRKNLLLNLLKITRVHASEKENTGHR